MMKGSKLISFIPINQGDVHDNIITKQFVRISYK